MPSDKFSKKDGWITVYVDYQKNETLSVMQIVDIVTKGKPEGYVIGSVVDLDTKAKVIYRKKK